MSIGLTYLPHLLLALLLAAATGCPGPTPNPDGALPDMADLGPDQLVPDQLVPDLKPDAPPPCNPPTATPSCTTDSHGIEWCTVKAGCFKMGSPSSERCRYSIEVQHNVTLTRDFEIMSTEVTQDQFNTLMTYNPAYFTGCSGSSGKDCPVETLSWHEAAAFCNALSSKAGYTACYECTGSGKTVSCKDAAGSTGQKIYDCKGYRLPTEAEWEYAYRAGAQTPLYISKTSNGSISSCYGTVANLTAIGWYVTISGAETHPVKQKEPNKWGLYDMAGNVNEWCHDWFGVYETKPVDDPVNKKEQSLRVHRGSNYMGNPAYLRAAMRDSRDPSLSSDWVGFRCARSL